MSETIVCGWCAEDIPAKATRCPKCQGDVAGGRRYRRDLAAKPKVTAAPQAAAGWYPHPTMVGTRRYWDGNAWTNHIAPDDAPATWAAEETEAPESWLSGAWKIFGPIIGIALVIAIVTGLNDDGNDSPTDGPDETSPSESLGNWAAAQVACKRYVKELLKAPSTSDFSDARVVEGLNGIYTVLGNVDAENEFGANLRSGYTCKVQFDGDDSYDPIDVRLLEN